MGLPKSVHRVVSRGREYFYFQAGRGTAAEGPRVALPKDPHSPEFWIEMRRAQGITTAAPLVETVNMVLDLYFTWEPFKEILSAGTQAQYKGCAKVVRQAWGDLAAKGLRPRHVLELMGKMASRRGMANNVLGFLQAWSNWGVPLDKFEQPLTTGVKPYKSDGGHKPWTQTQQDAALKHFTGPLRRGYFLLRHTGQRGSDVVRLGETFIDDGGFRILQKKNGKQQGEIWCPIEPELAAEMATWERRPGPYLQQEHGKVYSRDLLEHHFSEARELIPELAGATLHGLRATRVIELRQRGATELQIQDQVGMSLKMIGRYCRFADKKANGKAAVVALAERRKNNGL